MCIYCNTTNYRKIYEHHVGPIPRDSSGRKYEIHHIDGNKKNNHPDNLKCVSLQEHYDIHYSQGDWMACHKIAGKLKLSGEEISRLSRLHARQQLASGTHPFQKEGQQSTLARRRLEEGTHNFIGDRNPVHKQIANGTHNWLGGEEQRQRNLRQVAEGTHPFLGGEKQRALAQRRIKDGTHPFLGESHPSKIRAKTGTHLFQSSDSPTQLKWTCPHCGKTGKGKGNYNNWHGDNCRTIKNQSP